MTTIVDEATPVSKPVLAAKKSASKGTAPKSVATPKATATKKPANQTTETPATASEKSAEKPATVKVKNVRDTFNMPAADYALISTLKKTALESGLKTKKSELLRGGLQLLSKLEATELKTLLASIQTKKA